MNPAAPISAQQDTVGDITADRIKGGAKWAVRDVVRHTSDYLGRVNEQAIQSNAPLPLGVVGQFLGNYQPLQNVFEQASAANARYEKLAAFSEAAAQPTSSGITTAAIGAAAAGGAAISYKHMVYGTNPENVQSLRDAWRNVNTVLSHGDDNASAWTKLGNFVKNEARLNTKNILEPFKKGRTLQAGLAMLAWGSVIWAVGKAGMTGWQNNRQEGGGIVGSGLSGLWESTKKTIKQLSSWTFGSIVYGLAEGGFEKHFPAMKGKWYTSLASIAIATMAGVLNNVMMNWLLPNETRQYAIDTSAQNPVAGLPTGTSPSALTENPFDAKTQRALQETGMFT